MAERTFQLLASREGAEASVTGATQIRAGVLRPEILIPVDEQSPAAFTEQPGEGTLEIGSTVRIVRDPHFGVIGTVTALPQELHTLESGSRARVLVVRTATGGEVTVPRANVELIRQ